MIRLGQQVRDKVSGFTGIATAKVEYLNGCVQYCVKPKIKTKNDNTMPEGQYIDEGQLEIISKGLRTKKTGTGGPMSDVPSTRYVAN